MFWPENDRNVGTWAVNINNRTGLGKQNRKERNETMSAMMDFAGVSFVLIGRHGRVDSLASAWVASRGDTLRTSSTQVGPSRTSLTSCGSGAGHLFGNLRALLCCGVAEGAQWAPGGLGRPVGMHY